MMELDEGNRLLASEHGARSGQSAPDLHDEGTVQVRSADEIVELCINNAHSGLPLRFALCLALSNAADAVEIMCIGFILSDMDGVSQLDKELLSAAVFLGMFVGGLAGGHISDSIGRKKSLLISLLINSVAGLASSFTPSIAWLVVCRVLAGLGIGASVPIVFSLGAEIFPTKDRGYYLSVIASFWMVGAIYSAFTAWMCLGEDFHGNKILPHVHWRWFAAVSALPAMVALVVSHLYLPESPRYLVNVMRIDDAQSMLSMISTVRVTVADLKHANYHNSSAPVEVLSPFDRKEYPVAVSNGSRTPETHTKGSDHRKSSSFLEREENSIFQALSLLFGPEFRTFTIVLMLIWFTLSFGSYGISTWISMLFDDVGISNAYAAAFIFALANLPGNIVSLLFIDKIGRRWLLSVGMCLAGASTIGFALDIGNTAVVVLFASLFNAFSVMGWNSLDCLSAEGFPTAARSSAMGILAASGRLGAMAGQFVNGSLESNIPLLLFVTSACSVFGGVICWKLPHDTTNCALSSNVEDQLPRE